MPRGVGRGLHRGSSGGSRSPVPLSWLLVTVLITGIVGWLQLMRYEARLQARLQREDTEAVAAHKDKGHPSFKSSLRQGPQRTSQRCAAMLEASGVLPNAQGQRAAGAEAVQAGTDEAAQQWEAQQRGGGLDPQAVGALLTSRRRLYDAMEASLLDKGLALDAGSAGATQGLSLGDMFSLGPAGELQPVLRELAVPVRAIVMPLLDRQASSVLESAVRRHLVPLVPPNGVWVQDSRVYHSTIYHASTHLDPVPATSAQVDSEAAAVRSVGAAACPLTVVLERILATPQGTVLACWQVAGGTDVSVLRQQLAAALPGASKRQVVQDHSIMHTTLARVVAPLRVDTGGDSDSGTADSEQQQQQGQQDGDAAGAAGRAAAQAEEAAVLLQSAVDRMTSELCGLQAVMEELWFAEEFHKLALGLGGRYRQRSVPLQCGKGGGAVDLQQQAQQRR